MLWGRSSTRRGYRQSGFLFAAVIIFVIAVASTRSFVPFIPIFLLLFVILPATRREAAREGNYEKPKHDFEKPKRSGRYVESEDGTLLEVIDEQPTDRDDTDYV